MLNKIHDSLEKFLFNRITIFMFFVVFFKPLLFYYLPIFNTIFNSAMALFGCIIFIYYFIHILKVKKISGLQFALMLYILSLFISTAFGTHDFGTLARIYGRWLAVSFYTEALVTNYKDRFFQVLNILLMVLITLQTISTVVFPYGIINADPSAELYVYFLGNDNTTILTMVLGALFTVYYSHYRYQKLTMAPIATALLVNISFLVTWPATGIVAAAILDVFLLLFYKRNKYPKIFNMRNYFILAFILFLMIVVFRFQNLFSFLIEDILHKDLTLSARTFIWDRCISSIQNHPFIGLGVQEYATRFNAIGIYHAHCTFLNVLVEGGLIGFMAYLNIFRTIWNKFKKHISNEYVNILSFGYLIYFITGLVEVYHDNQMLQILLVLSYYINIFAKTSHKAIEEPKQHKFRSKVLVIASGGLPIPAIKGGAVESLTESYLKSNEKNYLYDFDVYSSYAPGVEQSAKQFKNSHFYYIHNEKATFQIERYLRAFYRRLLHLPINPPFIQKVINDIYARHAKNSYDIIIVENNPTLIPAIHKKLSGKIILHLHNDDLNSNTKNGQKIYNDCEAIFSVSDYIKNQVETLGKQDKVFILMNGINQNALKQSINSASREKIRKRYKLEHNHIVFVFSGRICPDKGVRELLQAFIKAQKANPNIRLLIVGSSFFDGAKPTPYIKQLQQLANDYKDKIIFTGYINHEKIGEIYSAADVQVIPSMFDDPCPLAVLEGMSIGLPQIVTLSGGIPEEVTEENAVIVQRSDIVNELANAIDKLANDPKLCQAMSVASLKRSKNYTENAYIHNFYHLLEATNPKGKK